MPEQLRAFLADQFIGTITPVRGNRQAVDLEWNAEVGASAVRLTESFAAIPGLTPDRARVSRFLGGYLPEGEQRRMMAAQRGISPNDLFAFLREYGGSLAGALRFSVEEEPPRYERMTSAMLGRALSEASDQHTQGARDDSRSMIPGFQPKVLLAKLSDGQWHRPHGSGHSTHILKPARRNATSRLYDEFYAHQLARAVGLASFHSEIRRSAGRPYLAIQRYDRRLDGDTVEVIHQEDGAQATGLDWTSDAVKFQDSTRPHDRRNASAYTLAEAFAALDGEALTTWLRQLTFRVLIGDNDGHAKNVSILHLRGEDRVADLYDAVPGLFQADRVNWDMALALDGVFDHRNLSRSRLVGEAESWGALRKSRIENTIDELLERFEAALEQVSFPHTGSPDVPDALRWNLTRLQAGVEIGVRDSA